MRKAASFGPVLALCAGACTQTIDVLAAGEDAEPARDASAPATDAGARTDARPTDVALLVTDVACGASHTCAVRNAHLFCFGDDSRGAVTAGTRPDEASGLSIPFPLEGVVNAVAVTAGESFSCALDGEGDVSCWGENGVGQLGTGSAEPRVGFSAVPLPSVARDVSAQFSHACALTEDDALYCWGENREGQMGLGDFFPGMPALSPVPSSPGESFREVGAGQGHTCAIRTSGALACWGRNTDGQLGVGLGAGGQLRSARAVGTETDWTSISSSQGQTCGIRAPGTLWCWGHNGMGQLGTGDTVDHDVPVRIGTEDDWSHVSVHAFGGCAVRAGELWCWGRNVEGQLGTGDTADQLSPTRVGTASDWSRVSAGRFHTCATRGDGTLWCTGENVDGRLGTGDFARRNTFTNVLVPADLLE